MGNSVGHGKEGTAAAFVFGGHGAVGEVVCKPKAHGSRDSCLVEDFPDESLGPDGVEGFADVQGYEKMVPAFGPRLVGCLDDRESLLFRRTERSEASLGGLDEALGLELVGEPSFCHPFCYLGEAREQGDRAEVGEGGGGGHFGDWDHDCFFPLRREKGAVERV